MNTIDNVAYKDRSISLPTKGKWYVCCDKPINNIQICMAFTHKPKYISGKWVSSKVEGLFLFSTKTSVDSESSLEEIIVEAVNITVVAEFSRSISFLDAEFTLPKPCEDHKSSFWLTVNSPNSEGYSLVTLFVRSIPFIKCTYTDYPVEWVTKNKAYPTVFELGLIEVSGSFNYRVAYKYSNYKFVGASLPKVQR